MGRLIEPGDTVIWYNQYGLQKGKVLDILMVQDQNGRKEKTVIEVDDKTPNWPANYKRKYVAVSRQERIMVLDAI